MQARQGVGTNIGRISHSHFQLGHSSTTSDGKYYHQDSLAVVDSYFADEDQIID